MDVIGYVCIMGKHLNNTQRNLVIDLVNQGKTYREIQLNTGIAFTTISSIVKKYNTYGTVTDLQGRGRKRKTTAKMDRRILMEVKKNRFQSAVKIAETLKKDEGIDVHAETIRNRIKENGFGSRSVRKKPFLTKRHMERRLQFAKKYVEMPLTFWKKVLWSDESKFNLICSDGKQKVWRKPGEEYKLSCMRGTVKFGGGNIMVWGCMAWNGVGKFEFIDDRMNAEMYTDILKRNLKSSGRKLRLGSNLIFQQDNDPKHTAKLTKEFLEKEDVIVLEWPAQSPDLNPIEHLWAILDREIGDRAFRKKEDLKESGPVAWEKIDKQKIKNLVESMSTRLGEVIKANGGPTRY